MAYFSAWFNNFLSRSESAVHPEETAKGDLTADRRRATSIADAIVELYLESETQPKSGNGENGPPSKLQELLSEKSFDDTDGASVSPPYGSS
jgi:hypothetical protein